MSKGRGRGRPSIQQYTVYDRACEKCNKLFMSRKEKKKHLDEAHRI